MSQIVTFSKCICPQNAYENGSPDGWQAKSSHADFDVLPYCHLPPAGNLSRVVLRSLPIFSAMNPSIITDLYPEILSTFQNFSQGRLFRSLSLPLLEKDTLVRKSAFFLESQRGRELCNEVRILNLWPRDYITDQDLTLVLLFLGAVPQVQSLSLRTSPTTSQTTLPHADVMNAIQHRLLPKIVELSHFGNVIGNTNQFWHFMGQIPCLQNFTTDDIRCFKEPSQEMKSSNQLPVVHLRLPTCGISTNLDTWSFPSWFETVNVLFVGFRHSRDHHHSLGCEFLKRFTSLVHLSFTSSVYHWISRPIHETAHPAPFPVESLPHLQTLSFAIAEPKQRAWEAFFLWIRLHSESKSLKELGFSFLSSAQKNMAQPPEILPLTDFDIMASAWPVRLKFTVEYYSFRASEEESQAGFEEIACRIKRFMPAWDAANKLVVWRKWPENRNVFQGLE
ncbi:hypothetical protein DL96DRAFT_1810785 [Flagelloscypha sp. PMI_526]|nr:hypothetical protein DL96DRAFT_1810785 [Flagelloscypha sp. PMI_526]